MTTWGTEVTVTVSARETALCAPSVSGSSDLPLSSTTWNEGRNEPDSYPLPPTRPSSLTDHPSSYRHRRCRRCRRRCHRRRRHHHRDTLRYSSCLHAAYLRAGPALHQIHSPLHSSLRDAASHHHFVSAYSSAIIIFLSIACNSRRDTFSLTVTPIPTQSPVA